MEFVNSFLELGKNLWELSGEWLGYIYGLEANMQNLKRKRDDLSSQKNNIMEGLGNAKHQTAKRLRKQVTVWVESVQKIEGDVQRLEQELVGGRKYVPHPWLGKRVMEKIQEMEEVQNKGRTFNDLLNETLPISGRFIPTTRFFGGTTSERTKEKVWENLMDDEVRRIGVVGMGGTGKTTIMHHINNKLYEETCTFDDVIWVTASKAFNIRKVQDEIAKALVEFDLPNDQDETKRASELHAELSRKKRFVLILDDLWEAFSLEDVGVPEPTRDNGCKLLLTTRSFDVCRIMECRTITVELFTEQEALDLFMSKVEYHQTNFTPEVKEIATKVANECARLPLAIITVARSMRGVNDIHEWRNALTGLINSTEQFKDNDIKVFERLKFSYSRLEDEKLQHCFLYCALYPEDYKIPIKELIEYWIAEGLIAEMNNKEAMFDKGHTILNKLVHTCLLESLTNGYGEECVRMHDLIRDMALKITTTSPRFMVQAGEGLKTLQWSEDLERVSLILNNIHVLPSTPPNCPRLTTLLLKKSHLSIIPDHFFMHMHCLGVLDLSETFIKSLPESISNLENLHALLLRKCSKLEYVPSLKKLKALKELKMSWSKIQDVPQGIEELVDLRTLDLHHNIELQTFPGWKLCRLSQLQYLRIDCTKVEVPTKELMCLTQLKVVIAQFHEVLELISYLTSQQCQRLEKYHLTIGFSPCNLGLQVQRERDIDGKEVRINDTELFASGLDLPVPPSDILSLRISRCYGLKSLSDFPSLRYARYLKRCALQNCNGMESIFSSSSSIVEDCQNIPLRSVEALDLKKLPNLRVLFDGVVPPYSINISFNLKDLFLSGCPSIKNIFPAMLLQSLPNLERLWVSDCEHMEDIIVEVEEEMSELGGHHHHHHHHHQNDHRNTITLPNFRHLTLIRLPRLQSIYKGIMVCQSLQEIYVYKCPMLRRLPLSLLHVDSDEQASLAPPPPPPTPPALRKIKGEGKGWWESLEWDDPHTKITLQPFLSPWQW